jgi:hypothetical protein
MNKKELAKLVYNHPIIKNLYKSSDKTVINKLIAEEVLKEADESRLNQLQKDLKFFQEEIKALESEFAKAKTKQESREIQAEITEFLGVIAELEKKISVLQKIQQPSKEAVQAVEAIVDDEAENKEKIKGAIQQPDPEKLKALANKFLQYNKKLSALKDLEAKVGTLASTKEPSELLKAIGKFLSPGKQEQLTPSLRVNNPDEKAKAAMVPSLVVVARFFGVDDEGIKEIEQKATEIKTIQDIPAYNEFAFQIMMPFVERNLRQGQTFDNFKELVTKELENQLPALIQKEQQPQQDQAQAGEEQAKRYNVDKLIETGKRIIELLPQGMKNNKIFENKLIQILFAKYYSNIEGLQEQTEEQQFSISQDEFKEEIEQGTVTIKEVEQLNTLLKQKENSQLIQNAIKALENKKPQVKQLVDKGLNSQDTPEQDKVVSPSDSTTEKGAEEPVNSDTSTEEPKAEVPVTSDASSDEADGEKGEESDGKPEEQIKTTEEAALKTTEASKEDAKVQKPVSIEEFKPIMNFMNDFFLDPSNPQVAGFMENVLLKYQSKQLYKFIAHLDTILSPEFQQAFTNTSNAEKPTPPEDGEEPTSATPTPTPASTPSAAPVTSVEQPKISEGILGNLFGSKNKEEQATVQIPKKNRAALREELLALVDLLKYLKLVVSNYEKNSTKTSIFNSYKGSSMKKVMDDLMNQVQSNLSYIMNEIQNARTAAETEQSKDLKATAAASKEQELQEQIYNKVLKLLKEADATSEDQTRKANVDFVKSVYEEMRGLYKSAMKTGLETLVKGGSAEDLRKLIDNAKKMKGYATKEKFISLFPTGQLVSGNVVTISDGLKALEQSIEGFIGLARDVATIVKSGEPIPSTQLTEAEYKIVDLATAIQENFGINSKIDQSIMTKIKAGLKQDPEQTPITDTANKEKDEQSSEEGSNQESADFKIEEKLQDFKMPTIEEAEQLLAGYDGNKVKILKQEQKIFLAIIAKLLGNGGSLQEIVGESILGLLFAASLSSLTKNLTELNRFEQAFERYKGLFSGIGYENAKKLALAAANIMIKNKSMFQKLNPLNSIHKIAKDEVIYLMADITNKNKDTVKQAEEQVSGTDKSEEHSENNPDKQSSETDDSGNSEEVPKEKSQMNTEDKLKAAKSQDTSEQVLTNLANEVDFEIKAAIAANPKTPAEILEKIANDSFTLYNEGEENKIKAAIAANPSAPEAVLRNFKKRSLLPEILASLATNPNLPQDIITDFINKGTEETKASLASNESLTKENFESLYNKTYNNETEMALATNPKTPTEILEKLVQNGRNTQIKHQASKALKTRGSSNNLQESRQLFKGQSLEEKLKPIIEKMLRQYYR